MIQCIACQLYTSGDPVMAAHAFGNCKAKAKHQYFSAVYPRECNLFHAAKGEDVERRLEWLKKKKKEAAR